MIKENIKEVITYEIDGIIFKTKSEAQLHENKLNQSKYLVIRENPDLTEGKYLYSKVHIYRLIQLKTGLTGHNFITIGRLVENILGKQKDRYSGIQGTLQLIPNFYVDVKTQNELSISHGSYAEIYKHPDINIDDFPYSDTECQKILAELIKNRNEKENLT